MNPFMNTSTSSQIPSELHELDRPCCGFFFLCVSKVMLVTVGCKVPLSEAKAAHAVQSTIEGLQWLTKAPVLQAHLFMFNFCVVRVVIWASPWICFSKVSAFRYVKIHSFLARSCETVSGRQVRANSRATFNQFVIGPSAVFCFSSCKSFTN